jgi:ADP-ribosylglycohydrolase
VSPSLPEPILQDRFRAALVGLAVGDALGLPLKGLPSCAAAKVPELGEDFSPRPLGRYRKGQFTAHTQLMLAAAESAVAAGRVDGRSMASHLVWTWHEQVLLLPAPPVVEAAERLVHGAPWMAAGAPLGVADASVLSRAVVPGLLCGSDPVRLAQDAGTLTVVTHKEPRAAAAAAAAARAVALSLTGRNWAPEAFCAEVAVAAGVHDGGLADEVRHLPRVLGWEAPRALELLRRVAVPASLLKGTEGLPGHVSPVLLVALYAALKSPDDFVVAQQLVLRCGGEADAAAALCGALVGARHGLERIPARLRRGVAFSEHLLDVADRLFAVAQRGRRTPVLANARAAVQRR